VKTGTTSQWYLDPSSEQNQPDLIAMPRKPHLTALVEASADLGFEGQDPIASHQKADSETAIMPAGDTGQALGKGSGWEPALGLVSTEPCLSVHTWLHT